MKTIVWFGFVLGAAFVSGTVIYTQTQSKVTLDCGVRSFSRSLVWHHGDGMLIGLDKSGRQRKGSSTKLKANIAERVKVRQDTKLEIPDVVEDDAGTFTCDADGKKHEQTLAVVSVSAKPPGELELGSSVTLQCRVNGLTSGPTVQWTRPDGSRAAVSGTVELGSVASSDAGTWKCSITPDGGTYTLKLKVKEQTPVTTVPSPTQSSKDGAKPACTDCGSFHFNINELQWWVWVAVGVGGLAVVLLMVFVVVMCKRIRRKKRSLLKMKNSRRQLREPRPYCQCNRPTAAARPQQGRRKEKPSTLHLQPLLTE